MGAKALRCTAPTCSTSGEVVDLGDGSCLWPSVVEAECAVDLELERQIQALFRLHDLNKNGFLEEEELIQLNKKTAKLHYGKDMKKEVVTAKYQELFRSSLDADGKPVPYAVFRRYMINTLNQWEGGDREAQVMILEQLIAEASLARACFHSPSLESASDAPYLPTISFDEALGMSSRSLAVDQLRRGKEDLPALLEEDLSRTPEGAGGSCCSEQSTEASALSPRPSFASAAPAGKGCQCPLEEPGPMPPSPTYGLPTLQEQDASPLLEKGSCQSWLQQFSTRPRPPGRRAQGDESCC
eukprot:TRINITY_DN4760_c0_g1_i1.p1 TRINITY_DN4760_c0_g1~~TRINITY_DN4760_c0_g1_i1.p1  ORF type:complete len:322 (+),score=65.53 TRINITY_DN4760_c0_g1_i1:73-966(+)